MQSVDNSSYNHLGQVSQRQKKLEAQWDDPVSLTFHCVLRKLYTEPFIDASYKISVHLAIRFQRSEEKIFFRNNQKQELPMVAMFVNRLGRNEQSLQRTFHRCLLPSFCSFGQAVSAGGEDFFQKLTIQKKELPVAAMFINGLGQNVQSLWRTFHRCFLPCFGAFGQGVSEKKIFFNRSIRNKNCLWRPCLLTDRDEMRNLYREPSSTVQVTSLRAMYF